MGMNDKAKRVLELDEEVSKSPHPRDTPDWRVLELRTLAPELARESQNIETELVIHRHWHDEYVKMQGDDPGRTPSMVHSWVRNLKSERDELKREVERLSEQIDDWKRVTGFDGCDLVKHEVLRLEQGHDAALAKVAELEVRSGWCPICNPEPDQRGEGES